MSRTNLPLAFLAIITPLTIVPIASAAAPSYDYIQVAYQNTEYADIDGFDLRGVEFRVSKQLSSSLFAEFNYSHGDDKLQDISFKNPKWKASLGYIQWLSTNTAIDYQVGYGNIEIDLSNSSVRQKEDADLYSIETNIRHRIHPNIEIYGGLEFQDWDIGSNQKAYHLGALYDIPVVKLGLEYTKFSDSEIMAATIRYEF